MAVRFTSSASIAPGTHPLRDSPQPCKRERTEPGRRIARPAGMRQVQLARAGVGLILLAAASGCWYGGEPILDVGDEPGVGRRRGRAHVPGRDDPAAVRL